MKLPGLDFDVTKYPIHEDVNGRFAMIPFSDWLPPDYENVLCMSFITGAELMYYSPATNLMVSPRDHMTARYSTAYKYWLKELP